MNLRELMESIKDDEVNKAKRDADKVLISLMNTVSAARTNFINGSSNG